MLPRVMMRAALLMALLTMVATGRTENADRIRINRVSFRAVTAPQAARREWFEADLELEARPAEGPSVRMTGRVRIVLELGFEVPATGESRRFEFYQAAVEAVGLEAGPAHVRFYLPYEITKRDGLRGVPPKYWHASAAWRVEETPVFVELFAASLKDGGVRNRFAQKLAELAAANRGLLVPQYLTPFAFEYPDNTPSFVRFETQ